MTVFKFDTNWSFIR